MGWRYFTSEAGIGSADGDVDCAGLGVTKPSATKLEQTPLTTRRMAGIPRLPVLSIPNFPREQGAPAVLAAVDTSHARSPVLTGCTAAVPDDLARTVLLEELPREEGITREGFLAC